MADTGRRWAWRSGCAAGLLVGAVLMAAPMPAGAAPFCVQTQALPPQCIYYDASSCNTRAIQLGGICSANESEVQLSGAIGHYCLVTSSLASSCIYLARENCDREERHQQGVCVEATTLPESPATDSFRDVRPLMAGH